MLGCYYYYSILFNFCLFGCRNKVIDGPMWAHVYLRMSILQISHEPNDSFCLKVEENNHLMCS